MNHADNDCLVVTFMTHGDDKSIDSFDRPYQVDKITAFFSDKRCPSLKGKPRLFFIQACRGGDFDHGIAMKGSPSLLYKLKRSATIRTDVTATDVVGYVEKTEEIELVEVEEYSDEEMVHNPPITQDCLLVRSAMLGFFSFRNITDGSWFIQCLCDELEENGTKCDIMELLTHVNLRVSERESNGLRDKGKKQILCISSKLTKLLFFNDKPLATSSPDNGLVIPY